MHNTDTIENSATQNAANKTHRRVMCYNANIQEPIIIIIKYLMRIS